MMSLMREEFHASQMKKPMPTPPISISAATIASQRQADADAQAGEDVGRGGRQHDLEEVLDAVQADHLGDVAVVLGDVADADRRC